MGFEQSTELRDRLTARPEAASVINRLSGGAMVIIATLLAAEHFI
jgi:threonine/homoserine/homoserine lactone efflux protein